MKPNHPAHLLLACFVVLVSLPPVQEQKPPPPDKPLSTNADKMKNYEDAIAPYVKQARETLPSAKSKFLAGLKPGEIFYLTIRIYDDQKRFEQVFLKVTEWKDNSIQGVIASEVALVKKYKIGDKLSCKPEEVYDWTISKPDGTEEGNFVGKFLDTYHP
jgi:uncharacterized protein YegJ (DUF2314 family)